MCVLASCYLVGGTCPKDMFLVVTTALASGRDTGVEAFPACGGEKLDALVSRRDNKTKNRLL